MGHGVKIRLGTRGSPLALAQAKEVRARLASVHGFDEEAVEIIVFRTTGDRITDRPLADVGGKGLFTKELEEALADNRIDIAVHSMKDVQTMLPDGLTIGAVLPREDVRDAFISLKYGSLALLPEGAVVGTSSLRRRAAAKRLRPDLQIIEFRGNVETRLAKLESGQADATFLAAAGLNRLGKAAAVTALIPVTDILPAAAQGAIGIEVRAGEEATADLLAPLNDQGTALCVAAERAFLKVLDGSCRTPIAALARLQGGVIRFDGMLLSPDGRRVIVRSVSGAPEAALRLAEAAAGEILAEAGPDFLSGGW